MKKWIVLIGFLATVQQPVYANEVTLVTDPWCPYCCHPTSNQRGILVEIANIILKKSGHTLVYKELNWARAIKEVRKGTYDGLIGTYKSDAPDFIFPNAPIMLSKMCFFITENDPWKFKDYDSLKGRKISVIKDYSYGEEFDAYIQKNYNQGDKTIEIIHGTGFIQSRIKLMALGRIDTILEDLLVFPHQVKANKEMKELQKIKGFKNVGGLLEEGIYIGFTPNKDSSQNYANLISEGLRELKASGELEKIINKYK